VLFAALFLHEKLRKVHIPALAAAMAGALLIIRPGFDFQAFPAFLGLLSAVFAGGAYTLVRALNAREDPMVIIFYFSAFSVICSIPLSIPGFVIPDPVLLAALLATGIFGAAGQYFITMSYRYGKASEVSIFNYSSVIFSLLIGYAGWGELPDLLSLIGSVIIIGAASAVYLTGRKTLRRDR
jgi:drug/metabolite transporter (DMT)-like permease